MRAGLGLTRANFVGTGAAPLDVETLSFFAKFGMTITDIWGEPARIDNRPGERLETVCLCVRNHVVGNRKLKLFFQCIIHVCLHIHGSFQSPPAIPIIILMLLVLTTPIATPTRYE